MKINETSTGHAQQALTTVFVDASTSFSSSHEKSSLTFASAITCLAPGSIGGTFFVPVCILRLFIFTALPSGSRVRRILMGHRWLWRPSIQPLHWLHHGKKCWSIILMAVVGLALPGIVCLTTRSSGASICNVCVGHPLDLIKVQMQAGPLCQTSLAQAAGAQVRAFQPSTLSILRNIFVTDGFAGVYRGVSAPLVAVVPAFAVTFWSYDVAKSTLLKRDGTDQLSIKQTILAGGFSGIPLAAIVGPSERIKCLMQVDKRKYSSFSDCAKQVYQDGGLRSLYRGTGATMMRDVPGNAAYFACYEFSKRLLCGMEGTETASLPAIFMAGGMAGVANWIIAIPFDVVKSRYQTAPSGKYRNLLDVLLTLINKEGVGALFRGLSPALLRAFPANAACLAGVETANSLVAMVQ